MFEFVLLEHRRVKRCGELLRNDSGLRQSLSPEGSAGGRALRAKEHRNGGRGEYHRKTASSSSGGDTKYLGDTKLT